MERCLTRPRRVAIQRRFRSIWVCYRTYVLSLSLSLFLCLTLLCGLLSIMHASASPVPWCCLKRNFSQYLYAFSLHIPVFLYAHLSLVCSACLSCHCLSSIFLCPYLSSVYVVYVYTIAFACPSTKCCSDLSLRPCHIL